MRGDALASGDRSAMFFPPSPVGRHDPDVVVPVQEFECVCGDKFDNVSDFVDHARGCDGKPKMALRSGVITIGRSTIEILANEGGYQDASINILAADDLFHKNPYAVLAGAPADRKKVAAALEKMIEAWFTEVVQIPAEPPVPKFITAADLATAMVEMLASRSFE